MRPTSSEVQHTEAPEADEFRKAMGLFTTGVCIVAVDDSQGGTEAGLAAMTVNSFVSVSLDPMLICWSLHNDSTHFARYTEAERFSVSILAANQADIARRYAKRGGIYLRNEDFVRSVGGLSIIAGSVSHFECRRWSLVPAGDHTMIFGEVEGLGGARTDDIGVSPLTFFQGGFCSITP